MQEYYPPLKARGMIELVGAGRASFLFWSLIAAPAATSLAVTFADAEGNPVVMADTDYVVQPQSEGVIAEVDESTKTTTGVTILSKDYAGAATNFVNSINLTVIGRRQEQPKTQL